MYVIKNNHLPLHTLIAIMVLGCSHSGTNFSNIICYMVLFLLHLLLLLLRNNKKIKIPRNEVLLWTCEYHTHCIFTVCFSTDVVQTARISPLNGLYGFSYHIQCSGLCFNLVRGQCKYRENNTL